MTFWLRCVGAKLTRRRRLRYRVAAAGAQPLVADEAAAGVESALVAADPEAPAESGRGRVAAGARARAHAHAHALEAVEAEDQKRLWRQR